MAGTTPNSSSISGGSSDSGSYNGIGSGSCSRSYYYYYYATATTATTTYHYYYRISYTTRGGSRNIYQKNRKRDPQNLGT